MARDLGAKSVTGIDIDRTLINIARKNVKHYVNCAQSPASNEESDKRVSDSDTNFFPKSMPISYGPIDIPGFTKHKQDKGFPYNVTFVQVTYVNIITNSNMSVKKFDSIFYSNVHYIQ